MEGSYKNKGELGFWIKLWIEGLLCDGKSLKKEFVFYA